MRSDLLGLSADALAQLSNAGLVKRAQRELAGGYRPELELTDATLRGRYPDGVETSFPPGAGLRDAQCTCGAPGVCRHRLGLILAYQQDAGSAAPTAPRVSPGTIDEAALAAFVPEATLRAADRLESLGLVVEVERGLGDDAIPVARLPNATVRFLAAADLAFARCDCRAGERCEHLVLAVRAFRRADAEHPGATRARIELGSRTTATVRDWSALRALLDSIVEHGVVAGAARHAQALTAALEEARAERATWMVLGLEALEEWLLGHAARSARFSSEEGVALLAELEARRRASDGAHALSAKEVLGLDEPLEAELGRTRLVSLGCRVSVEGERASACVALLDADTGTRMLLRHAWAREDKAPTLDASRIRIAGRIALPALAAGQIVGTTLKRRANGEVKIGATHGGRFSLTPQSGDWSWLPAHAVTSDVAALHEAERSGVPFLLRPRLGLGHFGVIAIRTVLDRGYDPVRQAVHAVCEDPAENEFRIKREHEAHAPGALDSIWSALTSTDAPPTHVAGLMRFEHGTAIVEPWAIATPRGIRVPDVDAASGALQSAEVAPLPRGADAFEDALHGLQLVVTEAIHHGSSRLRHAWRERAADVGRSLRDLDLGVADRFLAAAVPGDVERAASRSQPMLDLAIWLSAVRQCA